MLIDKIKIKMKFKRRVYSKRKEALLLNTESMSTNTPHRRRRTAWTWLTNQPSTSWRKWSKGSRRWRRKGRSRWPAAAVTSLTSCWKGTSRRSSSWTRPRMPSMKPKSSNRSVRGSLASTKPRCKSLSQPLATTASCSGTASATWTTARRKCSCEN